MLYSLIIIFLFFILIIQALGNEVIKVTGTNNGSIKVPESEEKNFDDEKYTYKSNFLIIVMKYHGCSFYFKLDPYLIFNMNESILLLMKNKYR